MITLYTMWGPLALAVSWFVNPMNTIVISIYLLYPIVTLELFARANLAIVNGGPTLYQTVRKNNWGFPAKIHHQLLDQVSKKGEPERLRNLAEKLELRDAVLGWCWKKHITTSSSRIYGRYIYIHIYITSYIYVGEVYKNQLYKLYIYYKPNSWCIC